MTVGTFLKTDKGSKYDDVLSGCDKQAEVEYWNDMNDYATMLAENHWSDEDIMDEIDYIGEICYKANPKDFDFVLVIS